MIPPPIEAIAQLRKLPKTEMHLHMEGALPYAFLRTLDSKRYADDPPSWAENFRFESFADFDKKLLEMVMPWYVSPERYGLAAAAVFARLYDDGVRYVETSFASGVLQFLGIDGAAVAEAIHAAAPADMDVRVFLGIHHDGRPGPMEKVLDDALSWKYLDGIDLHGDETMPLEPWTAPYWAAARKAGKRTKAHAGELCGPSFVRAVMEVLQVRQIEHGVRAVEDPALLRDLVAAGVVLDVCPTSNIKLKVAPSYQAHPLRALRAAGVRCTLNSDDPVIFGSDLMGEYARALGPMGIPFTECLDFLAEGWRSAKIGTEKRDRYLSEIATAKSLPIADDSLD